MQDGEDEQIFCLINSFYAYQKMTSKDKEIYMESCEMSALKQETKRERDKDDCVF